MWTVRAKRSNLNHQAFLRGLVTSRANNRNPTSLALASCRVMPGRRV